MSTSISAYIRLVNENIISHRQVTTIKSHSCVSSLSQDEAKRAVLSVLSMLWLLKASTAWGLGFRVYQAGHELRIICVLAMLQGDYEQMVSCQKLPMRLSRSTWTAIQDG